jgi:hypothetical protein
VTHSGSPLSNSRLFAWAASIGAFVAATALQVAIFAVASGGSLPKVPVSIRLVLTIAWLVLPAIAATFLSVRVFRLIEPEAHQRSTRALLAIVLLPLLSAYFGVYISFNIWGGK